MDIYELIPKLVRASLESDKKTIESIALTMARKLKLEYPKIADEILKEISYHACNNIPLRGIEAQPLPVDKESRLSLVNVEESLELLDPILDSSVQGQLSDFIKEREMLNIFLQNDIVPPNSILLNGAPGVGKTYIARWISYRLNMPLINLDLASSMSSYLGKSGQNIRLIFDYAKSQNAILFLDELDAIAKRRDDAGDLGELKRLVNVLLKELESCPVSCIVIGATNHPELLDKAVWRRFDRVITVNLPGEDERKKLILRHLDKSKMNLDSKMIQYLASKTQGVNAADVCKLCEHIKRQLLLNPETSNNLIVLSELFKVKTITARNEKVNVCHMLKKDFPYLSQRDISQITSIPLTSVSRYISTKEDFNV